MPRVWIGVIDYGDGSNIYAGETEAVVWKQMAAYCVDWWSELGGLPMPEDAKEAVETYFMNQENELCTFPQEIIVAKDVKNG